MENRGAFILNYEHVDIRIKNAEVSYSYFTVLLFYCSIVTKKKPRIDPGL